MPINRRRWGFKKPIADRVTDRIRHNISLEINGILSLIWSLFIVWFFFLIAPLFVAVVLPDAQMFYTAGEYISGTADVISAIFNWTIETVRGMMEQAEQQL